MRRTIERVATSRRQQFEATRRKLIKVSRRLFVRRGYAGTSIEDICRAANVTRGGLYHHFKGKDDIFRAVFEQLEGELLEKCAAAADAEPRPERRLHAGINAFLDECLDRDAQQITVDAPSALGWERWQAIDAEYALAGLMAELRSAMELGYITNQPVEPLAQVLLAAMNQAALVIARADDVAAARRELGETLERLVDGLAHN
jgi:AcrR family transcriptional regulator